MSNETILTLTLSALTVAVAAMTGVFAALSIWGYQNIKSSSHQAAEEAAKQKLAEFLNGEQIQDRLKTEVAKHVSAEADRLFADLSLSWAYQHSKGGAGKVGAKYPGEDTPNGPNE